LLGIAQVQRMFGVDICAHAAWLLCFGDDMQRQCGFAGGFRAVDLDYAAARNAADTKGDIETERSGRDYRQILGHAGFAELHDRALAELAFDLAHGEIDRLLSIYVHLLPPSTGRLFICRAKSLGAGDKLRRRLLTRSALVLPRSRRNDQMYNSANAPVLV